MRRQGNTHTYIHTHTHTLYSLPLPLPPVGVEAPVGWGWVWDGLVSHRSFPPFVLRCICPVSSVCTSTPPQSPTPPHLPRLLAPPHTPHHTTLALAHCSLCCCRPSVTVAKVFESGVQDESEKDDIFCFPRQDHQVLTSEGFLSYAEVKAWDEDYTTKRQNAEGQFRGPVMIASPVLCVESKDGREREYSLTYQPMSQLIDSARDALELVSFCEAPIVSENVGVVEKGERDIGKVDLLMTRNHKVLARVDSGSLPTSFRRSWRMMTAEDIAGFQPPRPAVSKKKNEVPLASFVQVMDLACHGLLDSDGDHSLPFVEALGLTEDQIDPFCELYGYWTAHTSAICEPSTVTFQATEGGDPLYLEQLLLTVGLQQLPFCAKTAHDGKAGYMMYLPGQRSECETDVEHQHRLNDGLRRYDVQSPAWVTYFSGPQPDRYNKRQRVATGAVAVDSLALNGADSAKGLFDWVWQLNARRLRLLLRGTRFANGGEQKKELFHRQQLREKIAALKSQDTHSSRNKAMMLEVVIAHHNVEALPFTPAELVTSSVRSRDQYQRLALNAGFACVWRAVTEGEVSVGDQLVNASSWRVQYSNGIVQSPTLEIGREVKVVQQAKAVPVWCVSVPTEDHLIVVRRVSRNVDGVITDASRPIIVGNSGLRPGTEESVMLRQIRQGYVMKPLYNNCMHFLYEDKAMFNRMKALLVRVGREVFKLNDKEIWRMELFCCGFLAQFFDSAVEEGEWKELERMERELKEREDKGETEVDREDMEVGDDDEDMEVEQIVEDTASRLRRKRTTQTSATSVAAAIAAEKTDGMEVESDAGSVQVGVAGGLPSGTVGGKAQKKKGKRPKPGVRSRQRRPPVKDEMKTAEAEEEEEEKEDEVEVDVEGGGHSRSSKKTSAGVSSSKGDDEKDSGADDDDGSSTSNKPRMSPSSSPPSTHSIATITRDILAAHANLPSSSSLKPMTVSLSSFALDQSLHPVRRHSRPSNLFFGSNAFYVFFRLHQFLYDRLYTAKQLAYKPRKGSTKKKIPFSGDERYARFNALLDEYVKGEEKGESKFEDECRNLLGASSYVLFTMDKLVHQLIKQVMALLNSEVSMQLLALYAQELRRARGVLEGLVSEKEKEEASVRLCRQYQYAVSLILANDNVTQMEFFLDKREIGIGLVEGLALSDGQGTLGMKVIAYQDSHDADYQQYMESFIHQTDGGVKTPALQRNIERGKASLKGVDVSNRLEVKVCMKSYRLLYVEDSEDVLVRRPRGDRGRVVLDVDGGDESKVSSRGEVMNEWVQGRFMELNPDWVNKGEGEMEEDEELAMRVEGEGGEAGEGGDGGEQEEEVEGVDGDAASEAVSVSASPSPAPPASSGSQGGAALFNAVAAAHSSAEQEASPAPTPTPSSPVEGEGNGI